MNAKTPTKKTVKQRLYSEDEVNSILEFITSNDTYRPNEFNDNNTIDHIKREVSLRLNSFRVRNRVSSEDLESKSSEVNELQAKCKFFEEELAQAQKRLSETPKEQVIAQISFDVGSNFKRHHRIGKGFN
jgi:hydroxymethylpyrimidine pyrophosphatase-like HAD family hydrolase